MLSSGEFFFVFIYCLLFILLILKATCFKKFGIPVIWIAVIFLIKIFLGISYGLIHFNLYQGGDTFGYFNDSKIVLSSLPEQPWKYLQLVFGITQRPPDPAIAEYAYKMNYSTDMSSYFIVRVHSILNLFTYCHYYANVVIYNFFTMAGQLLLYKFFVLHMPDKKKVLLILLFIFPSVSFWCSGMHKDGIAIAALGLILFHSRVIFNQLSGQHTLKGHFPVPEITNEPVRENYSVGKKLLHLLLLCTGIWLLLVVRNYLLMLVIPCLISYYFSLYTSRRSVLKYVGVIFLFYLIAFQLKLLSPAWNILNQMALKQQEFLTAGEGKTDIELPILLPETPSLINHIPEALFNCLFLPSLLTISSPLQITSSIDNLILLFLFIGLLLTAKWGLKEPVSLFLFCMFFAASVFIFTGTIVPNIGALVRYKMPGTLFLAVGLISRIDTSKIKWRLKMK